MSPRPREGVLCSEALDGQPITARSTARMNTPREPPTPHVPMRIPSPPSHTITTPRLSQVDSWCRRFRFGLLPTTQLPPNPLFFSALRSLLSIQNIVRGPQRCSSSTPARPALCYNPRNPSPCLPITSSPASAQPRVADIWVCGFVTTLFCFSLPVCLSELLCCCATRCLHHRKRPQLSRPFPQKGNSERN